MHLIDSEAGRLDVLVNNAGDQLSSRIKISYSNRGNCREHAGELPRTNVFGVVTVTNAFIPLLLRSDAGRIVNVTSKRGSIRRRGSWVGRTYMAYSTSKTALNALTVHYARSLAETSIKVNGAAPGHVATDFNGFRGPRTPEQGAVVAIRLAQLDGDGPTGLVFEDDSQLAW